MNIALIGYGKMGKAIEKIAEERGHTIALICNSELSVRVADFSEIDVAIEFSQPHLAVEHIYFCIENKIPVVVGTTGWNKELPIITERVQAENASVVHASNFSVGVNLFFELNKKLAQLMNTHSEYKAGITEIHHTEKLDAPSGTAITIAEGIIDNYSQLNDWSLVGRDEKSAEKVAILAERLPNVPGTHTVHYTSEIDTISITHEAHSRKGFALGAVIAAEWIKDKKGIYTMADVLNF
jgi:4-hydroxy-tetrahydrodipicolinate reductase